MIDQMKFNKEEIEEKKSVEIQEFISKRPLKKKKIHFRSVTKQLEEHKEMNEEISDF